LFLPFLSDFKAAASPEREDDLPIVSSPIKSSLPSSSPRSSDTGEEEKNAFPMDELEVVLGNLDSFSSSPLWLLDCVSLANMADARVIGVPNATVYLFLPPEGEEFELS
jgi:hypothetical protein